MADFSELLAQAGGTDPQQVELIRRALAQLGGVPQSAPPGTQPGVGNPLLLEESRQRQLQDAARAFGGSVGSVINPDPAPALVGPVPPTPNQRVNATVGDLGQALGKSLGPVLGPASDTALVGPQPPTPNQRVGAAVSQFGQDTGITKALQGLNPFEEGLDKFMDTGGVKSSAGRGVGNIATVAEIGLDVASPIMHFLTGRPEPESKMQLVEAGTEEEAIAQVAGQAAGQDVSGSLARSGGFNIGTAKQTVTLDALPEQGPIPKPPPVPPPNFDAALATLGSAPQEPGPERLSDRLSTFFGNMAQGAAIGLRGPRGGGTAIVLGSAGAGAGRGIEAINARAEARNSEYRQDLAEWRRDKSLLEQKMAATTNQAELLTLQNEYKWKIAERDRIQKKAVAKAGTSVYNPQDGSIVTNRTDDDGIRTMEVDNTWRWTAAWLDRQRVAASLKTADAPTAVWDSLEGEFVTRNVYLSRHNNSQLELWVATAATKIATKAQAGFNTEGGQRFHQAFINHVNNVLNMDMEGYWAQFLNLSNEQMDRRMAQHQTNVENVIWTVINEQRRTEAGQGGQ
jgi:hypothetical protein